MCIDFPHGSYACPCYQAVPDEMTWWRPTTQKQAYVSGNGYMDGSRVVYEVGGLEHARPEIAGHLAKV